MLREYFKQENQKHKNAKQNKTGYLIDHKEDTCLEYESWNKKAESHLVWFHWEGACQVTQMFCSSRHIQKWP